MKKPSTNRILVSVATLALLATAHATQFSYLDPTYTQEIFTGPLVGGPAMAWTNTGNMLTRNGSDILEYSFTQNAVHLGTNVHGVIATHTITGLSTNGFGMARGTDGYIYVVTAGGLQRFNPNNWALFPDNVGGPDLSELAGKLVGSENDRLGLWLCPLRMGGLEGQRKGNQRKSGQMILHKC